MDILNAEKQEEKTRKWLKLFLEIGFDPSNNDPKSEYTLRGLVGAIAQHQLITPPAYGASPEEWFIIKSHEKEIRMWHRLLAVIRKIMEYRKCHVLCESPSERIRDFVQDGGMSAEGCFVRITDIFPDENENPEPYFDV